jgi:hypothetical protein
LTLDLNKRRLRDEQSGREYVVRAVRRASTTYSDRFTIVFHEALAELARRPMAAVTSRLWAHLLTRLDFNAWRRLPQRLVARELGVGQAAVSKGLAQLMWAGWVERRSKSGMLVYRLDADRGWRGSAAGWHAHQDRRRRERASGLDPGEAGGEDGTAAGAPGHGGRAALSGRPRSAGAGGAIEERIALNVVEVDELRLWLRGQREAAIAGVELTDLQRRLLRRYRDVPSAEGK